MKIIIAGYGRMGKLIEQTAIARGHEIAAVIDMDNAADLEKMDRIADVILDFSGPALVPQLCAYVKRTGTALLSGTTGMPEDKLALLREAGQFAPVIYSGNYSTGIAVFREILEKYASLLLENFDCEIVETHHNQKVDAPSGTAQLLYEAIDPNHEYSVAHGREGIVGKRPQKEIGMHSLRGGTVAGIHTVSFFGTDETIEITHTATSRQIFVNGALNTAVRLIQKPAGYYSLKELLF